MSVLPHFSDLETRLLTQEAQSVSDADALVVASVLPRGTRLQNGAFVLEDVLGRGGFGITYRARDCRRDCFVAIKEFFPTGCTRANCRVQPQSSSAAASFGDGKRQFLEEARVLSGLRHPNIVRVMGAFEENATAYLVMEYLQGETLLEHLEARGPFSPDEAIAIIEKVGGALEAVHRLGMLHLDIKPENVFLCDAKTGGSTSTGTSAETNARRVVLMDFDLMRHIEGATTYQTRPLSHTFHCGTPGYAPLEQYTQGAQFGTHTDIYALGATLYHLLTGGAPLAATDRAHHETSQGTTIPDALRAFDSTMRDAVAWALEIKPKRRPQTVREFLLSLRDESTPVSDALSPHMSTHGVATSPAAMQNGASNGTATSHITNGAVHPVMPGGALSHTASHTASHINAANGEWHLVRLASDASCEWPLQCACCCAQSEGFLTVASSSKSQTGSWQVPYCRICLRHVRAARIAWTGAVWGMGCGLCLALTGIATSNLYVGPLGVVVHFTAMSFWALKSVFAEQTSTKQCGDSKIAVTCTALGRANGWKFKNPDYAAAFRQLNAANLV